MYAYRQIQQALNRTVVVHLPKDFPTDQVEVIVLPASTYQPTLPYVTPEVAKATNAYFLRQHKLLTLDTSHFTVEQHKAYKRASAIIQRGRQKDEPRIWGVFEGLIEVADDFDAPLADEELFWGEGTDQYGMSLES